MPLTSPQKQVVESKARFKVLVTGRRFGKTHLAIRQLIKYASEPNKRVWFVCPTYRQAKQVCWAALKDRLLNLNWIKKTNESDLSINLINGSIIALRGADRSYDSLRGVGLDYLVMDEFADIASEAWFEVLRATLSDRKGGAMFTGTPRGYGNWAYDLFCKGAEDNDWDSFQFTTLDGGQVDDDEIEQAKADLDERTFRQEYLATFETYAGSIYYNFDREQNVKRLKIDETAIHIGMDFNIDPMSAAVFQLKNNVINFIDEIVIYSSNTDELVKEIKTRYPNRQIIVYPDPACRQRKTSAGGRTDLSILQNGGFTVKVKHRHPAVRDRINAVNSKLKDSKGIRHIFVSNSCKYLIKGLQRQTYKEDTNIPDKEDGFDHMNDALGYMIDYIKPLVTQMPSSVPTRWVHK